VPLSVKGEIVRHYAMRRRAEQSMNEVPAHILRAIRSLRHRVQLLSTASDSAFRSVPSSKLPWCCDVPDAAMRSLQVVVANSASFAARVSATRYVTRWTRLAKKLRALLDDEFPTYTTACPSVEEINAWGFVFAAHTAKAEVSEDTSDDVLDAMAAHDSDETKTTTGAALLPRKSLTRMPMPKAMHSSVAYACCLLSYPFLRGFTDSFTTVVSRRCRYVFAQ
jgi:hypothetical protein